MTLLLVIENYLGTFWLSPFSTLMLRNRRNTKVVTQHTQEMHANTPEQSPTVTEKEKVTAGPGNEESYKRKSFRMGFQMLSIFCPAIILTHDSLLL